MYVMYQIEDDKKLFLVNLLNNGKIEFSPDITKSYRFSDQENENEFFRKVLTYWRERDLPRFYYFEI